MLEDVLCVLIIMFFIVIGLLFLVYRKVDFIEDKIRFMDPVLDEVYKFTGRIKDIDYNTSGSADVIDAIEEQVNILVDKLIDDRKSTCANCIHGDVCSNQWLMHPDTEMKDICKNFEMKPKDAK